MDQYQPSCNRGTRSLPATPYCLFNPNWPTGSRNISNPRFFDQIQWGVFAVLLVQAKTDTRHLTRYMLFRRFIWVPRRVVYCSGGYMLFRGVICCSEGLYYAVQDGYMDVQEGCIQFRGVICYSEGLYAVQGGYMLFRRVIWMFRRVTCWRK